MTRRSGWLVGIGLLFAVSGCGFIPRIVILHDPLTPQEHLQLGLGYETQRDWKSAEREYRAALDLNPEFLPALANLGNVYAQQGQYHPAEKKYRRLLKRDPNHPMANNNLAWIFIQQGIRPTEAAALIDRALAADPEHRAFYIDTRALLLLNLGRLNQARSASLEAESSAGSDAPGFADQHMATRSKIEAAIASLGSERPEGP